MAFVLFALFYVFFLLFLIIGLGVILPLKILRFVWKGVKEFVKDFLKPLPKETNLETKPNQDPYNKENFLPKR